MASPDTSAGGNELVIHVSTYVLQGRKVIDPPVKVVVFSSSQQVFKDAYMESYRERNGESLICIQYVDGSGRKSMSVEDLQMEAGKAIRIVFDEVQSGD